MSFIQVEDIHVLEIGVTVKLEGSWFSHPFPTNSFTIKTAEELATLKGLTDVTILYDPNRSQPLVVDDVSNNVDVQVEDELEVAGLQDSEMSFSGGEEKIQEEAPLIPKSALSEIFERREDYREYFEHLRKVEGNYQKTLFQGHELFRQLTGRRPAGLKTGDAVITNILQEMNNPNAMMALIDQVGNSGVAWGLSEHAINVCTLSLLIGRQFSLEDEVLMELGRGALFHDIGYRALPMNVKFYPGGIKVEADPELSLLHPEMGMQLIASFLNAGPILLDVIAHHHERMDGSGFPKGLGGEDLSLLTRIVMVADHFDELCNAPDPKTSLNPHAALARLYRHVVMKGASSKFCEQVVQALVQAIGVYPPGSLVELTDGFRGLVSSINIQQPMKPIVLLYAPWLCRNDGLLVNLAKESQLEIKQAVHPKHVPEQELAYLSPRRMAMFVHTMELAPMGFDTRPPRMLKPALRH